MKLCEGSKCRFYYIDTRTSLNTQVQIFSYKFTSFIDWLEEGALECGGIMFELHKNGQQPVRIMTRTMEKFFNFNENLFTMNLDLSEIDYATIKADGSLVRSYIDEGELH